MKHSSLFTLLLVLLFLQAGAQYNAPQNMVWIFGRNARLDFSSGAPVAGGVSPATVLEGGACVSDHAGNLLFYTDGDTVFNKLGMYMPSGADIAPYMTSSTTQSSLIVPFINDTGKYYVFSLEQQALYGYMHCHLAYSVVDMTLDGGLGDVVPGTAGTILGNEMGEKLIAIPGNNCNVWVIAHKKDTTLFYVYEVTDAGISAPTIYNEGTLTGPPGSALHPGFGAYCYGAMKASHDRQRIFTGCWRATSSFEGMELYDFNPTTGVISNCQVITNTDGFYSAEFSPDNSKLYAYNIDSSCIVQYDLSLPSPAAINASRTRLTWGMYALGDLRLAPDGKIYFPGGTHMHCITHPNAAGTACGFVTNAVPLPAPSGTMLGLPNLVWASSSVPAISGPPVICLGSSTAYTSTAASGAWSNTNTTVAVIDAATGVVTALAPGVDTIMYSVTGQCYAWFAITVNPMPAPFGDLPFLCEGQELVFSNAVAGGTWSSSNTSVAAIGATSGIAAGLAAGVAAISYSIGPCIVTAPVVVHPAPPAISGPSGVCARDTITLENSMPGGHWTASNAGIAAVHNPSGQVIGIAPGMVTISYSAAGTGCFALLEVTVTECPLGVGSITQSCGLQLYPSPAHTYVEVLSGNSALSSGATATLYDIWGRALLKAPLTGHHTIIPLETLAKGTYRCVVMDAASNVWLRQVMVKE